jgi:DNA modification methylase
MVEIFREVRRVLRKDGTLWLNLGDSYTSGGRETRDPGLSVLHPAQPKGTKRADTPPGLKPKDLVGIPWRVAFALQSDGWYLRSDIIWSKPNPMPESVTDRPTKAHEYLFLLTKSARYFYDSEAIKERNSEGSIARFGLTDNGQTAKWNTDNNKRDGRTDGTKSNEGFRDHVPLNRNKRSVWTVATAPYPEAHFATYPPDLIKPCILAGTSAKGCCAKCGAPWERIVEETAEYSAYKQTHGWQDGNDQPRVGYGVKRQAAQTHHVLPQKNKTIGWQPTCDHFQCSGDVDVYGNSATDQPIPCTVLEPFAGSGTTGAVALELGRKAILIELNPKYVELIDQRCNVTMGLQLA